MISLRTKLWLGFGGLLMILLIVSALSMAVLTRYSHALERVFRENYDSAVYCDGMKESLDQLNIRAQRLIWEESAARQTSADVLEAEFESNLGKQLKNVSLPGELERTRHLGELWTQYKPHYQQFESSSEARKELYRQDLLPRYQEMKQVAQQIADMNMSNMLSVDGQVKRTLLDVRNALLIFASAGTLLAILIVSAAGPAILHPLKAMTHSARQIESGNLDLSLPVRSRDEIGQLAKAFNSMASRLREFRRLDHDRLVRTQQTTQLAIDSLPDAVFVIGPSETIEISNRIARIHLGIEPGAKIYELHLQWLPSLYEHVKDGQKAVDPQGYQSAIQVFENGDERFLLPRAVPMIAQDGKVIGVTVILVDVTRLRRADEAKSGLVSTVSHELRTPLTSIRMAMNMMADTRFGKLSANQDKLLTAAREDSDRLYRIIENLLNISRIEAGREQFQFRAMSPGEIVAQAVGPLRSGFAEKKLRLEVTVPEDLPDVKADPIAVGSALTNLLSNALKYTPTGGEVRVSCEACDDVIAFSVADTGPGIPEQFRARVFDKFFRVSQTSGPTGVGLGLAIAKEIIDAHGGHIELRAGAFVGCVFRFTLPLAHELAVAHTD